MTPLGTRQPDGDLKVAIRFPRELFERLAQRAESDRKGFSQLVCEMAALGLFDVEECERHEPTLVHG